MVNQRAGRAALAEELYRRVLDFDPNQPDALHLMGTLELARGRPEAALALLDQAVAIAPDRGDLQLSRAGALARLSRAPAAAEAFAAVVRLSPEIAVAHHGLGRALAEIGRADPRPHYRRALALAPDTAVGWNDLGVATQQAVAMHAALKPYSRAVAIDPGDALALRNLAGSLTAHSDGRAALRRYRRALALAPADADTLDGFGSLFSAWGEIEPARRAYDRAIAIENPPGEAWSHRLFFLNFVPGFGFAEHYRENRRWGERIEAGIDQPTPVFANPRDPSRKIRLAYISPDLVGGHNQLAWLLPLLAHHDRREVEVHVYADVARPDSGTQEIARAADAFASIHGLDRAAQAAQVRADGIDIAVNLCGWVPSQRILFAHRLAPIQVAYANHVTTTGLRAIDHRLTDAHIDPPGIADPYYTERLVWLETGYASYLPPPEAPEVAELPFARNGYITFGSANQVPKMSAPTIALWARILAAVPSSRLALKAYNLSDPVIQRRLRACFAAYGIAPERLVFFSAVVDPGEHYRIVGEADLGLDPFPFNGGKSTCDALWMGVPVVTLAGDSMMSRVGVSMIGRAGLPELVTADEEAYFELAVGLARDPDRLAELRRTMRARLSGSVLLDGRAHTRELETVYRRLWRNWCQAR
jgi:protein O-GlcNAc transferase